MRLTIFVLLLEAILAFAVAAPANMKTSIRVPRAVITRLQNKVTANGGCNINVCFAIDGSGSLGQNGFDAEKQFIFDIEAIIAVDGPVGLAATQFGATNSPIIQFTSNLREFHNAVSRARFLNDGSTNISEGISFCVAELRKSTSGPKKIVVLTDGQANTGDDPAAVADSFRAAGGEVCAVGVGVKDESSLLDLAGGDSERVLSIDDFFKLASILEDLIEQVCGF